MMIHHKYLLYKGKPHNIYATPGSAGIDLVIDEDVEIKPGEKVIINSSYRMDIPNNMYGNLTTRSSISINRDIILLPTNAIIDSDYKSNIKFCFYNTGKDVQVLNKGERVAQIVFHKYHRHNKSEFIHQSRTGGIGSTGTGLDA